MIRRSCLAALVVLFPCTALGAPPEEAFALRHEGLAQLENERPIEAEAAYRSLVELLPDDPLGHANLAIALIRQQRFDEAEEAIGRALELAPGRGDLLAVRAAGLSWSGQREEAIPALRAAHEAAPNDLESLYALYRHASAMRGEDAEAAAKTSLARLRELRPENLFVLLKAGQMAVDDEDRAAATSAYLRIRELVWQVPGPSQETLDTLVTALEENDLAAARRPARVLENLFKGTPLYTASLGEIFTNIQGIPIRHFVDEEPSSSFGPPLPIHFVATRLDTTPATAAIVADLNDDGANDAAVITAGEAPRLEIRLASDALGVTVSLPAPGVRHLRAIDLDNDGALELLAWGPGFAAWKRVQAGSWARWESELGLGAAEISSLAAVDYDIEGDLDLAVIGPGGSPDLYRNTLEGPLQSIGERALPADLGVAPVDLIATDLDRDGDVDLLGVGAGGVVFLDNLRQGHFGDRTADRVDAGGAGAAAVTSADLDNDGWPELVLAGDALVILRGAGDRLRPWAVRGDVPATGSFSRVTALDVDNDGRLDLAMVHDGEMTVLTQPAAGLFVWTSILGLEAPVSSFAHGDLDGDGDLDLLAAGEDGIFRLDNVGGNRNGWLSVQLQGLSVESQKNNHFGIGSAIDVHAGAAYQFREATEPVTHFGLGDVGCPDVLRVTWTNGVPQDRLQVCAAQRVVEEQVLKGSCPFLYTEGPDGTRFVTDLLWGAPLGMPVGEGAWAGADIEELVKVEGAVPGSDGHYRLHITEELWEAAFFDTVRLHVVDHPAGVETASSLRVVAGETVHDRVLATAAARPVAAAWDGRGRDVTDRVRKRDEIYAAGYPEGLYQGATPEPWSFRFDLGEAPDGPVRLLLDGWIFPADASLNLAIAQRVHQPILTRLEMRTADGWRTLIAKMGHPAGKTKVMVVDTPPLPPGVRELRIVSSKWLHWDRVAWSTAPSDDQVRPVAELAPASADLHFRGFSKMFRATPNGPHLYDYADVDPKTPWLSLPGHYTRYGDVRELLEEPDDRLVILAPGDEMSLGFDASRLPPVAPGWQRSVFLESHGWDKDADRNTWEGHRLEPLPFRAQSGYPWAAGEEYPDTPELRRYRDEWLTRKVN